MVLYVFRTLVDDEIPMNAGCLKPIEIVIPTAACCRRSIRRRWSPATSRCRRPQPTACTARWACSRALRHDDQFHLRQRDLSVLRDDLGRLRRWPTFDGTSVVQCHMTNSRLTDPEVLEFRYPVRVDSHTIHPGTGGNAATHHGGDGADRRIRFLEPMTAAILGNNCVNRPHGMAGGEPARLRKLGRARWRQAARTFGHICEVEMQRDDVFVIQTPGGGGFSHDARTERGICSGCDGHFVRSVTTFGNRLEQRADFSDCADGAQRLRPARVGDVHRGRAAARGCFSARAPRESRAVVVGASMMPTASCRAPARRSGGGLELQDAQVEAFEQRPSMKVTS